MKRVLLGILLLAVAIIGLGIALGGVFLYLRSGEVNLMYLLVGWLLVAASGTPLLILRLKEDKIG